LCYSLAIPLREGSGLQVLYIKKAASLIKLYFNTYSLSRIKVL
jgi:hypothetical protein